MRKLRNNTKEKGYTILEALFYISFFAVLSLLVIQAMLTMSGSFGETALYARVARGADVLERISREIRGSESIASIGAGSLLLNTRDGAGNPKTVQFSLAGTDIELRENNALIGDLNGANIAIDNVSFASITTGKSVAVKIQMTVRAKSDSQGRTFDFYDTVVLRGSY